MYSLAIVTLAFLQHAYSDSSVIFNVEFDSPTFEPGLTQSGLKTFQGSMPIGNGAFTAQGRYKAKKHCHVHFC